MITLGTFKPAGRWCALALAASLAVPGQLLAQDAAVHEAETAAGDVAKLMEQGGALYNTHCGACHQPTGQGLPGAFPPLAESDYLMQSRTRAIETVIKGLTGEIEVNNQKYNAVMPGMGHLSDADIAAILTYVTNAWGNEGSAFAAGEIAKVRADTGLEDRAVGERHPGATEGEMRYQGTPSPIPPGQSGAFPAPGPIRRTGRTWHSATRCCSLTWWAGRWT